MALAACTIVSSRNNAQLDAYVLSESSLFVYPTKWVLKTCGTTKLLNAVPRLLEMAAVLGMEACRCKYSRASFLFPEQQPFPYTSFDQEAMYLRKHFGHLGGGGSAYVLGDMFNGLQWHIYVADAAGERSMFSAPTSLTWPG
jgi:S-adenosylmethionine decarboxylase proenzyme